MATFATVLDMPSPMNKDNFDAINDKRHDAYVSAATKGMRRATLEVRKIIIPSCENDYLTECVVFTDEFWQPRIQAKVLPRLTVSLPQLDMIIVK